MIFDSVKDMLTSVTSDESGLAFNTAVQLILAGGTDTLADHHLRKATADNRKPDKLSDVYGSNWLTAGQGSVVLLWVRRWRGRWSCAISSPIREPVRPLAVNYDHAIYLMHHRRHTCSQDREKCWESE